MLLGIALEQSGGWAGGGGLEGRENAVRRAGAPGGLSEDQGGTQQSEWAKINVGKAAKPVCSTWKHLSCGIWLLQLPDNIRLLTPRQGREGRWL